MFTERMPWIITMMAIMIPAIAVGVIIFTLGLVFNPKLRGKMMSRQLKALKHMQEYSKEDLTDISTTMGDIGITSQKRILDQNADNMEDIAQRSAQIQSGGVETLARAAKKGFTKEESMYCKHCGSVIDADSKYCKNCGGLQ